MESTPTPGHKLGVSVVIIALVLGLAGVVAAQTGPSSDCSGDVVATFGEAAFGLEDEGNRLLSTTPTVREFPLSLAPGTYALNGVSYDGYDQRETIVGQTQEQWFVELVDSSGTVLATSGITADLEDGVTEATWTGDLGEVTIDSAATAIRVVHAAPGSASVNSVRPVCVGAVDTSAPATTEAPTTTTSIVVAAPTTTIEVVVPGSTVGLEFVSTSQTASTVALTCGELTESALGVTANLELTEVPASSACDAEYPAALDCAMRIDPISTAGASSPGLQVLNVPAEGDANIMMILDCVEPQVAAVTTTTAPAAVVTTTTAPPAAVVTTTTAAPAVQAEVANDVERAKTATAQAGQPDFTG